MKSLRYIILFASLFICFGIEAQDYGAVKGWTRFLNKSSEISLDGLEFGKSIVSMGDIDKNGYGDFASGLYDAGSNKEGAAVIIFMKDSSSILKTQILQRGVGGISESLYSFNTLFGSRIDVIPDLDGDGINELLVANSTGGSNDRGEVFIFFLDARGFAKNSVKIGSGEGGFSESLDMSEYFGSGLACIGDVNEDGIPDLAIGSIKQHSSGNTGRIYVLFLKKDGTCKGVKYFDQDSPDFNYERSTNLYIGQSFKAAGDMNQDGVPDLILYNRWNEEVTKRVILTVLLRRSGGIKKIVETKETKDFVFNLASRNGHYGFATKADINGDGFLDYVIARGDSAENKAIASIQYLFLDTSLNIVGTYKITDAIDGFHPKDGVDYYAFGDEVALMDDINGDGMHELLISSPNYTLNGKRIGLVYLVNIVTDKIPVSTQQGSESVISLYPNPAHGTFALQGLNAGEPYQLSITTANGQQLYTQTVSAALNTVDAQLPPGIYIITLTNRHEKLVKKLIVK